jgi:hypothetical protein
MEFDAKRAILGKPDGFPRYRVSDDGDLLSEAGLSPTTALLVAERGGIERAFLCGQLAFHHLAQGTLKGKPYLVTF